jgi:hypothetical protein
MPLVGEEVDEEVISLGDAFMFASSILGFSIRRALASADSLVASKSARVPSGSRWSRS